MVDLGDRYRIEHVVANFLSNAIKFSPEYSTIKITVSYGDKLKGHVTFTVADQGSGIPPEHLNSLFTSYMQINPGEMQQGKGTGVGLSICKEIVTLHGGKVGCTSKLREGEDINTGGSKFYFSIPFTIIEPAEECDDLPRESSSDRSSEQDEGEVQGVAMASQRKEFNVLIVDDVSSNRKMLSLVLSKKGLECEQAGDGFAALEIVQAHPLDFFDFVFMDSRMPKMSGLVTTQKLRELGFRNILIGFTGNAMEEDVEEFLAAGVDIVLPKPLKMAHLDSLLQYCSVHGSRSALRFGEVDPKRGPASGNRSLAALIGIDKH